MPSYHDVHNNTFPPRGEYDPDLILPCAEMHSQLGLLHFCKRPPVGLTFWGVFCEIWDGGSLETKAVE